MRGYGPKNSGAIPLPAIRKILIFGGKKMEFNIRDIYKELGLTMDSVGLTASFADNLDGRTLVTIASGGLEFFNGTYYVVFSSYVYNEIYEVISPNSNTFVIDTPFMNDEVAIKTFDVTKVYSAYLKIVNFTNGIKCLAGNVNLDAINELLVMAHFTGKNNIKSIGARSHTTITFESLGRNTSNEYWISANSLSNNCLTNHITQPASPNILYVFEGGW